MFMFTSWDQNTLLLIPGPRVLLMITCHEHTVGRMALENICYLMRYFPYFRMMGIRKVRNTHVEFSVCLPILFCLLVVIKWVNWSQDSGRLK